jgi:hypothetical protein
MNQLKQAHTNRGHRLFWVVSVGRKWTRGIWFEHPIKVSRVPTKVTYTWKDLDGNAIPTLQRMARAMYKRQSKMPKSVRKALFYNDIGETK